MQPSRIPTVIAIGNDEASAQPPGVMGIGVAAGAETGLATGMAFIGGTRPIMPAPAPPSSAPVFRISKILEGNLIRRVQPVYPPLARSARIQGSVVLAAVISKAGAIENLRVLSGHPMLAPAAKEAVSQWRYRPYILNSEPIEVQTEITVNFVLGAN
jgi:protein TonB